MRLERRARVSGDQSHDERLLPDSDRTRPKVIVERQRHRRAVESAATDQDFSIVVLEYEYSLVLHCARAALVAMREKHTKR